MLFEFILFAILGWHVFKPAPPNIIITCIFVVLMVVWLIIGFTGIQIPHANYFPR